MAHSDLKSEFLSRTEAQDNGCWHWTGNVFKARGGYGCATFRKHGIINKRAHRLAWELFRHKITPEHHVLHKCDNPLCVNPDHLFLGNQWSNMRDRDSKNRQNRGENHGMCKLTEPQALAVLNDKRPQKEIASDYGISVPTVSDIKRGHSWKHLPRV